jgi:hypothetical protein
MLKLPVKKYSAENSRNIQRIAGFSQNRRAQNSEILELLDESALRRRATRRPSGLRRLVRLGFTLTAVLLLLRGPHRFVIQIRNPTPITQEWLALLAYPRFAARNLCRHGHLLFAERKIFN